MGAYLQRKTTEEKFEFVEKYGKKIFEAPAIFDYPNDPNSWVRMEKSIPNKNLPMIVLNNGSFYAFALAPSLEEFDRFMDPSDPRIESIWLVDRKALEKEESFDYIFKRKVWKSNFSEVPYVSNVN